MRLVITLFVIVGLIVGWFKFQDWRKDRTERYWSGECMKWLEPVVRAQGAGSKLKPDEAAYFKLLHFMHKTTAAGIDMTKTMTDAITELGITDEPADLIRESIKAAYEEAKKLMILDDISNQVEMEKGNAPLIKLPGWEDDKAAFAQIVPASLAPEAARQVPNLEMVPASVRDARGDQVTPSMLTRALTLERCNIISRQSRERVQAALQQAK